MSASKKPKTPLAERIIALRDERGWTQEDLAEAAGLSSVAMIESGARPNPKRQTLEKIAQALGVRPSELIEEPEAERLVPVLGQIVSGEEVEPLHMAPLKLGLNPSAAAAVFLEVDGLQGHRKGRILLVHAEPAAPEMQEDAVLELEDGRLVFRRVVSVEADGTVTTLSLRSMDVERVKVKSVRPWIATAMKPQQ